VGTESTVCRGTLSGTRLALPVSAATDLCAETTDRAMTNMDTSTSNNAPRFLTIDTRVPSAIRDLMNEADGCGKNGFLTGGTACAQRVIQMLTASADGQDMQARIKALADKYPGVPTMLTSILQQFGDATSRDGTKLSASGLNLLVVTLKAVLYEIYVLGPERNERLDYIRKAFESIERKGADKRAEASASAATAEPVAAAS